MQTLLQTHGRVHSAAIPMFHQRSHPWLFLLSAVLLVASLTTGLRATAQTVQVLGIGTAALLDGDLTDPENDGNEAAGPFDASWNWRAITSNNEPGFGGGEFAFNIFDNRVGTGNDKWCCDDPTFANPLWVNVEFHQPVSLTHFTITSGNDDPTRDPRDYRIQGSNDGVNYADIYVRSSGTALWNQRNQVLKITLAQPASPYVHIRYLAEDTSGSLHQLNEIEYFGTVVPLPFTVDNRFNPTGAYVVFDQPVDPATVVSANFAVAGLAIQSLQLQPDGRTVVLTTAPQAEGQTYALTVQGVLYAGGGAVSPGPVVRHWTHGFGVVAHRITHDRWDGIAGTTTDIVTGLATYPNSPSFTTALPRFEIPPNIADNYGGRIYGLFNPPSPGGYTFYVSSDDQSQLFLSTDASPANSVQIAREPNWNGSREYVAGSNQATRGNPPANISAPINLTAGQPVWLELLYKEGDGGDNASATAQFPGGAAIVNGSLPLGEEHFAVRYRRGPDGSKFLAYGPAQITQHPGGVNVVEGASVVLVAAGDGSPPHRWQWRRNGDVVQGANGPVHTFTAVPGTEGSYTVTLANDFSETTSTPAVVNVAFDTTAPTLVSARGTEGRNRVRVQFSEAMDAASVTTLANYSLTGPDGALAITGAQSLNPSLVELLTAKQPEGALFTLKINNVTDTALAKNPVAPNSSGEFRAYVFITGAVLHRRWNGVDTLAGLTGLARFPDLPDEVTLEPLPEYPANGGNEAGTGYGNLLTFWWTPEETGDYEFFISADDQAELWLSNDDDPANKKRIAVEPSWNNPRQWVSTERRNATAPENRSTTYAGSQWPGGPGPIHLVAGQRYFIEAVHAEGSGGDNVGINVRRIPIASRIQKAGTPTVVENEDPPNFFPHEVAYSADPEGVSLALVTHPQDTTVFEGRPATFSASAVASQSIPSFTLNLSTHLQWQWQCAPPNGIFVDLPGATGSTLTLENVLLSASGQLYRAIASVGGKTVTSQAATLIVNKDVTPPRILKVTVTGQVLNVTFDENLDPASVVPANFQVTPVEPGPGLNILGVTPGGTGNQVRVNLSGPPGVDQWCVARACVSDLPGNTGCDEFCFRRVDNPTYRQVLVGQQPDWLFSLAHANSTTRVNEGLLGGQNYIVNMREGGATSLLGVPGPGASGDYPALGASLAYQGTGAEWMDIVGDSLVDNVTSFTVVGFFNCASAPVGPPPYTPTYNPIFSTTGVCDIYAYNLGHGTEGSLNFRTALGDSVDAEIKLDQWYFLAAVANGSVLTLYLNGLPPKTGGSATTTYGAAIGTSKLGAGSVFESGSGDKFVGKLSYISLWKRALTPGAIAAQYAAATASANVHPPTVTGPGIVTCEVGQTCTANLTLTDLDTLPADCKLAAHASDENIFPAGSLVLGGEGGDRTISLSPAAGGSASIKIDAFDGTGKGTWIVNVTASGNNPPVAAEKVGVTSEDQSLDFTLTATDPENDPLTYSLATPPANGTVSINGTTATYTPNPGYHGNDSFTYRASDGPASSAPATVSIQVGSVNDAPTFAKGADQTVKEDSALQTVSGWATSINAGHENESAQVLTFQVSNNNNPLFAVQPAIAPDGTLTYTPAPNANGTANVTVVLLDDGGTLNGGVNTSGPQTFTITVQPFVSDVAVSLSSNTGELVGNGTSVVNVRIENVGTEPSKGGKVVVLTEASVVAECPPGTDCAAVSPHVLNFNVGELPPTGFVSYPVTIQASGAGNEPGRVWTHVTTTTGDPNQANNQAGRLFTVNGQTEPSPEGVKVVQFTQDLDDGVWLHSGWGGLLLSYFPTAPVLYLNASANGVHFAKNVPLIQGNPGDDQPVKKLVTFKITENPGEGTVTIHLDYKLTEEPIIWVSVERPTPVTPKLNCPKAGHIGSTVFYRPPPEARVGDKIVEIGAHPHEFPNQPQGPNECAPAAVSNSLKYLNDVHDLGLDPDELTIEKMKMPGVIGWTPAGAPGMLKPNDTWWAIRKDQYMKDKGFGIVTETTTDPQAALKARSNGYDVECDFIVVRFDGSSGWAHTAALAAIGRQANGKFQLELAHDLYQDGKPDTGEVIEGALELDPTPIPLSEDRPDTFVYDVSGTVWGGRVALLSFIIEKPVNVRPKVPDETQSTPEDTAVEGTFQATDHEGNPVTFRVVTQPGHGTLVMDAEGHWTYTPAANYSGPDRFVVEGDDGRGGISRPATVTVNVTPVNDPPDAQPDAFSVAEDGELRGLGVNVRDNDTDPEGEPLTVARALVKEPAHGLVTLQPDGSFVYWPNLEFHGTDTFTYKVSDPHGAEDTATVTITVMPVNDPPTFGSGGNRTVNEDAGAQTVPNQATEISPGAGEAGQSVGFNVTTDKSELFSQQPAVSADGTLTFTPAPNASGTATVTVTAKDDGDTENGGQNTSLPQTFTIAVNPVNDAPSFTKGADQSVQQGAGAQTVPSWATGIGAGGGETGQTVKFVVTTDKPELFSQQPAVSADGTLTYTPVPSASGTATVTVTAMDDGGTGNGGQDTSAPQTFTITIEPTTVAVFHPSLPTSDNRGIPAWEFAKLIDLYFEDGSKGDGKVDSNIMAIFGFCFGADFIQVLNELKGEGPGGVDLDCVSFTDATALSPNKAGLVSFYGGATVGMVTEAKPGEIEVWSLEGGKPISGYSEWHRESITEEPQVSFSPKGFKKFGGKTSTHVLVWAGQPNAEDQRLAQRVVDNFAGHPDTTITVLSGDRAPGSFVISGTTVKLGPATRSSLKGALKEIGGLMDDGEDEQFIFIGLDHGAPGYWGVNPPPVPPGSSQARSVTVSQHVHDAFSGQADPKPSISVVTEKAVPAEQAAAVLVDINNRVVGSLRDASLELLDSPEGDSRVAYHFTLPRDVIAVPDATGFGRQTITIQNTGTDTLSVASVSLSMGAVAVTPLSDLGDAPDSVATPRYPTLRVHDGARHAIHATSFHLGAAVDPEADGRPGDFALSDDEAGSPDDEDGVRFLTPLMPGQPARIEVTTTMTVVKEAKLNAWLDFNADSDWLDTGEQILTNIPLAEGVQTFEFTVPADAKPGRTYARFRMNRGGGLSPNGPAESGEVEDYAVEIVATEVPLVIESPRIEDGKLRLEWSGTHVLQRASSPAGPWEDVLEVTSPFEITPTDDSAFFRLRAR